MFLRSRFLFGEQEKLSNQHHKQGKPMNSLTSREREIVFALVEGLSNKDIGRRLIFRSEPSSFILHNIYQKLGVKTRSALVALAYAEFAPVRPRPHAAI